MPDTHAAQAQLEPWQWPEAQWRKLVNQVRAGRAYKPKAWKGGAPVLSAISAFSRSTLNMPSTSIRPCLISRYDEPMKLSGM